MVLVKSQHFKARAHHYAAVAVVGPTKNQGMPSKIASFFIPQMNVYNQALWGPII